MGMAFEATGTQDRLESIQALVLSGPAFPTGLFSVSSMWPPHLCPKLEGEGRRNRRHPALPEQGLPGFNTQMLGRNLSQITQKMRFGTNSSICNRGFIII